MLGVLFRLFLFVGVVLLAKVVVSALIRLFSGPPKPEIGGPRNPVVDGKGPSRFRGTEGQIQDASYTEVDSEPR